MAPKRSLSLRLSENVRVAGKRERRSWVPTLRYAVLAAFVLLAVGGLLFNLSQRKTGPESKEAAAPPEPDLPPSRVQASPEPLQESAQAPKPVPVSLPPESGSDEERPPDRNRFFPYSLKTGAFRDLHLTRRAATVYLERGLSPYWTRVDLGEKGVWFRVFLGHFATEQEAKAFKERHGLEKAKVVKTEYAALIGTYGSPKDMEKTLGHLRGHDMSPYAIEDPPGWTSLYVGAFLTEAGARQQVSDLAPLGIPAQAVRR
ncbi:MAG: SPOR domain-containing protein [Deltaproteobacteria bacterium]|nr:SPOR domain-containing protein [Deltaproteobacteria bacterium]